MQSCAGRGWSSRMRGQAHLDGSRVPSGTRAGWPRAEQTWLWSPALRSVQPGGPGVGKSSCCCFLVAESSGRGCDVPGRGLRAANSPPCPLQQLPTPRGLGWKLSTAKCGLLLSYLEFCPNWWQFGLCQDAEQSGSRAGTAAWASWREGSTGDTQG